MASKQQDQATIAYLFTTFPKLSERFLQRELDGLAGHSDLDIEIHSMLGGMGDSFHNYPLIHLRLRDWLTLPFCFMREFMRRPDVFHEIAVLNDVRLPKSLINTLEHYLGLAFAITRAAQFRRRSITRVHAVWATGPASAALLLSRLNEIPFSMGCHAYDLFRHGGDVLLAEKIQASRFIHTTTKQAREELINRGANPEKIELLRRSAPSLIEDRKAQQIGRHHRSIGNPMRILSVGRLIEKKGYFDLLNILHFLATKGLPFEAKIIGDGPLHGKLQTRIDHLGLTAQVILSGRQPFESVAQEYYNYADVFFFNGKVATSGDRDGLPNVVIEAMTACLPVLASDCGGVTEAIMHGESGVLLAPENPEEWFLALQRIQSDPSYARKLGDNARAWVEQHCAPKTNALALAERLVS